MEKAENQDQKSAKAGSAGRSGMAGGKFTQRILVHDPYGSRKYSIKKQKADTVASMI